MLAQLDQIINYKFVPKSDEPVEESEKSYSIFEKDEGLEAEILQQDNVLNLQENVEETESYKSEPAVEVTDDDFLPEVQIQIEEARNNKDVSN